MLRRPLTRRAFAGLLASPSLLSAQSAKPRKRRADSFFGLHFDLHPAETDKALGRDVTREMVTRLLDATRPDYVQYDSKGHRGLLGWTSDVGPSAPGILNDSLRVWRDVTAERGVALYIHFSGVWDAEAIRLHADWARLDATGKPDGRNTSTFGPYVDELMIPELREAASKYNLDGVWVDGECWSVQLDYSPRALAEWKKATGRDTAPAKPNEPNWHEWVEFNRESFRKYVRHYVDALHQSHPRFQVASNWLYSTLAPEEPALPVDFLSGDYLGNASISRARLEARYLAQNDRPWDLMAWGFQQADSNRVGHIHKPAVQLQQEAAVVLAQGGGFQVYYQPSRTGHFEDSHIQVMGKVARFCRDREAASHKSESIPQIGVVFSKESLYRRSNRMFGGWGRASDAANGWLDALLACQWSVDVIPDWKLAKVMRQYPLLVLPDWLEPADATFDQLLDYAKQGGRLIVSGAANAQRLAARIGYQPAGDPADQPALIGGGEVLGNHKGLWLDVEPGECRVLESRYPALDSRGPGKPAALARSWGAGEVVIVPGPTGDVYMATHAPAIRDFVRRLVAPRFTPLVAVEAPPTVEVALRRKGNRTLIHLLNSTAMQVAGDFAAVDFVPPIGPIRLNLDRLKPKEIRLLPENRPMRAPYRVERLEVHSIVAVI